jgi:hypothetical protein
MLVALPLLAILFSSMRATPARAAVVMNMTIPFEATQFVPCANGGAGEDIHVSGPLHELASVTLDGHGGFHTHVLFNLQGVSGVGLTTGNKYQGTGIQEVDFNGTVGSTFTFVNNFNLIGQGPGNNFKLREFEHFTINANGTVTVDVDNFSVTCM